MLQLLRRLSHVNYNFCTAMEASFVTGLKLKNNLTSNLVPLPPLRTSSSHSEDATCAGTHADPPSTQTATWDTPETISAMT